MESRGAQTYYKDVNLQSWSKEEEAETLARAQDGGPSLQAPRGPHYKLQEGHILGQRVGVETSNGGVG